MNVGFFEIVFECNSHTNCAECKYSGSGCDKFNRCFDGAIPCGLWRSVTCFEALIKYINDWGDYQNEQTVK